MNKFSEKTQNFFKEEGAYFTYLNVVREAEKSARDTDLNFLTAHADMSHIYTWKMAMAQVKPILGLKKFEHYTSVDKEFVRQPGYVTADRNKFRAKFNRMRHEIVDKATRDTKQIFIDGLAAAMGVPVLPKNRLIGPEDVMFSSSSSSSTGVTKKASSGRRRSRSGSRSKSGSHNSSGSTRSNSRGRRSGNKTRKTPPPEFVRPDFGEPFW
jgi:hypothetical protein